MNMGMIADLIATQMIIEAGVAALVLLGLVFGAGFLVGIRFARQGQ